MRTFNGLDEYETVNYEVIFTDGVARHSNGEAGVAVLFDPDTSDDPFDTTYPFPIVVHGEISHISAKEARALRDALSEVLDA